MTKVLFMQNCFVPDDNQYNRLTRSLKSLQTYVEGLSTDNSYSFALGGYIAPEYLDRVMDTIRQIEEGKNILFNVMLYHFKKNLGKGRVCNYVIENYCKTHGPVDELFMFDNDIVFEDCEEDIVQMLLEQRSELNAVSEMKYPVVSCNFKEHQVHNEGVLDFGKKVIHGVMRCSTGRFGCIGGGCWLVSKPHWDKVGGYTTDAIYGKDDGKFYLDTIKMKDRMVALSQDIYVIHPSDDDIEYNRFKADTNVNRCQKMNYQELTEDMNRFWEKRNANTEQSAQDVAEPE